MDALKNKEIIEKTKEFVKEKLGKDTSGHDYWHCIRVYNNAITIAKEESKSHDVDLFIVSLAALLHDVDDYKLGNGNDCSNPKNAILCLSNLNIAKDKIDAVCDIISKISFKGAKVKNEMTSIEGFIVQDADRLDAIGAVGIARTFAFGGSKQKEMHNPNLKPILHDDYDKYKNNNGSTINHFYEKLLLLKDLMNTKTAKKIAEERHKFMEQFLEEFFIEWDGKDLV